MLGWIHPSYCQITILLVVDPFHHLPIKTCILLSVSTELTGLVLTFELLPIVISCYRVHQMLLKKSVPCWWRSSLSSFRVEILRCRRELAVSCRWAVHCMAVYNVCTTYFDSVWKRCAVASYPGLPMFFNAREKNLEGLVNLVNVMTKHLPPFLPWFVEMVADTCM